MKCAFCFAAGIIVGSVATYSLTPLFQQAASPPAPSLPEIQQSAPAPQHEAALKRGDLFTGTFKSIYDGDTFRIADGEKIYNIRVWGIDAPELKQACQQDSKTIACGKMAKDALEKILHQGSITCTYQGVHRDRIISTCTVNGNDVSASLIRQGLALEDKGHTKGRYNSDEAYARNNKLGLWNMTFDQPSHWRACNLPIAKDLRRPADCSPSSKL